MLLARAWCWPRNLSKWNEMKLVSGFTWAQNKPISFLQFAALRYQLFYNLEGIFDSTRVGCVDIVLPLSCTMSCRPQRYTEGKQADFRALLRSFIIVTVLYSAKCRSLVFKNDMKRILKAPFLTENAAQKGWFAFLKQYKTLLLVDLPNKVHYPVKMLSFLC